MSNKFFKWVVSLFHRREKLDYPGDFAIIDFSQLAQQRGLKQDRNKVISRYFMNRFGNMKVKKYRYSEERVQALKIIHKIPIYDRTKKENKFPVFARILPQEIRFIESR